MVLDPWKVLDVTDWTVDSEDNRGRREKRWLLDPDKTLWLRKQPRESRPYEIAIEAWILRVARTVGIPAPESYGCQWVDGGKAHRGIAVCNFVDRKREELWAGAQVLAGHDPTYRAENKHEHTPSRVLEALQWAEKTWPGCDLVAPFLDIQAFDAWIGNGDRHQDNWGIIVARHATARLSPMYDPAACLGAELLDAALEKRAAQQDLSSYIENCPSGFGDGAKPIKLARAIGELARDPRLTTCVHRWVAKFKRALDTEIESFAATIPPEWLPPSRRDFAIRLLTQRLHWLQRMI